MKLKDAILWDYSITDIRSSTEVRCPECGSWAPISAWDIVEVPPEDKPEPEWGLSRQHSGMECPHCKAALSCLWGPKVLEARNPEGT